MPICEAGPIIALLQDMGLQMYASKLVRGGFDDLETLAEITDVDIKDLGIPPCHGRLLRQKSAQLREKAGDKDIDPGHPVLRFLQEAGLEQFARAVISDGFDDLETLMLIGDSDLEEFGFRRGHVVKLRRRLRERQLELAPPQRPAAAQLPASAPQSRQSSASLPGPRPVATMLTSKGRTIVEQSWDQVQSFGTWTVGELLYKHFFSMVPAALELFPPEVRQRYREWMLDDEDAPAPSVRVWESAALRNLFGKIVNVVGCTVAGIHAMDSLVPMLLRLGARHASYGVREGHWELLGEALDRTLQDLLRAAYTPEVKKNWSLVYSFVSAIMIEGFRQAGAAYAAQGLPSGRAAAWGSRVSSSGRSSGLSERS